MAKRKKARKTIRRRKIGAINPNSPLVKYGSIAAGYFLGEKLNKQIDKVTGDKIDGKIVAAAEAGIGLFLVLSKGKKTMLKTVAGGILTGAGIKKGLTEFGVINGFMDVPVLAGYRNVPVLNGYNTAQQAINGFNVPATPLHQSVMGGFNFGSGINTADR